jgi:hypothetical protein
LNGRETASGHDKPQGEGFSYRFPRAAIENRPTPISGNAMADNYGATAESEKRYSGKIEGGYES